MAHEKVEGLFPVHRLIYGVMILIYRFTACLTDQTIDGQ